MAVWAQSNESWVKANKLLPQFPGCAAINKAQDAVGCQGILPAHAQAAGYHGLQLCPRRAACQWLPRMHQWPEYAHLRLKTKLSASFHKVSASSLIKLIWMAARPPSALSAPHHSLCQQCLVSLHPCHWWSRKKSRYTSGLMFYTVFHPSSKTTHLRCNVPSWIKWCSVSLCQSLF